MKHSKWRSVLYPWGVLLCALPAAAQGEAPPPDEPASDPVAAGEGVPEKGGPERGKGRVSGRLTSATTGEPLADVAVDVVGTEFGAVSDQSGNYRLDLAPGRYTLRFWSDRHEPMRAGNVVVWAGGTRKVDLELTESESPGEEFVIEEAPAAASVDALAQERKKSASVGDAIGRAEISKTPDRDAAQAARRVVGATIQDGRFVYVRGLGERYTNALLNGAPLPSPEPDRAAVPLDLFPTQVLESLTIVKSFTPDVPGDFAGGSVRVETRRVPDEFIFSASLSASVDTNASFRERLDHRGGDYDWLGIDDGTRSLPDTMPSYKLTRGVERPDGTTVDDDELNERGRDLNTYMSSVRTQTPPSPSGSIVLGDGFKLGEGQRFGYLASFNYRQGYELREELRRQFEPGVEPDALVTRNDLQVETGAMKVGWGAFGSLLYEASPKHRLNLLAFHSQLADDRTQHFDGFDRTLDSDIHNTRLNFVSRALNVGQLHGHHEFESAGNAKLEWNLSIAEAVRVEPDTRDVVYVFSSNRNGFVYVNGSESGRHFFSDQSEQSYGVGVNFTQPLEEGQNSKYIKVGVASSLKDREFWARRFALTRANTAPPDLVTCDGMPFDPACPDKLFLPDNIGPALRLDEGTEASDAYHADLDVHAVYAMSDLSFGKNWRLILGERLEVTNQVIDPIDQFESGELIEGADLESTDLLPAASLIYSFSEKTKLRSSISRTLARPQLRELAPFAFSDFFNGYRKSGNPDLELTRIVNADLRFEYFPELSEVLAVSLFYKSFSDPIEPVVKPSGDRGLITFQNAASADLYGVELEVRLGLDNFAKAAKDFAVVTNLTLATSSIELIQTDRDFLTNLERSMVNQAPYVYNLAFDYDNEDLGLKARILYNVAGKSLVQVGSDGLDDAYEHELHQLDFTLGKDLFEHVALQFAAKNLLNPDRVVTIGKNKDSAREVLRYGDGVSFSLGASYSY